VLQVPGISFKGINVKNISLARMDFEIDWEVENKNNFTMDINELTYNLVVNNSQWITGKAPDSPRILSERKTVIPLAFSIDNFNIVKEITGIISRGSDITYSCQGNMNLGGELPALKNLDLPFNFNGTAKLRN
jgi:LEA14-like dessication related protein